MNTGNYKVQPFDLDTALANPDWVYFRNGEKPLEWHWFKTLTTNRPIIAVLPEGGRVDSFCKRGFYYTGMRKSELDLVLHVPEKKIKITVFVWDNGRTTVTYSELEHKGANFDIYCQQAEKGLCTRHEFEVEVTN